MPLRCRVTVTIQDLKTGEALGQASKVALIPTNLLSGPASPINDERQDQLSRVMGEIGALAYREAFPHAQEG